MEDSAGIDHLADLAYLVSLVCLFVLAVLVFWFVRLRWVKQLNRSGQRTTSDRAGQSNKPSALTPGELPPKS